MSVPIRFSERVARSGKPPISYLMEQAVANPNLISLAAGLVDQQSLPVDEVRAAVETVLSDPVRGCASLQYGTTNGDPNLRRQLVQHLRSLEGPRGAKLAIEPERMIVGTGSQQLLYLLGEVLLDPGDMVILGVPAYFVFMGVLESMGTRMVAVTTDADGLVPEAVEAELRRIEQAGELDRVKFIYDVSYYNNPTGLSLSESRRRDLVDLARRWSKRQRILIVEDAAYRELRYRGADLPSILSFDPTGETVLYAGTFSKPFAPGMKTGFLTVPEPLLDPLVYQKGHHDFGSANFGQQVLAEVLAQRTYHQHLETLRAVYRAKLDVMLHSLTNELANVSAEVTWTQPEGGLYVWLQLPATISTRKEGEFFQRCLAEGVLYVPGEYCYPRSLARVPDGYLRLSFGVQPIGGIEEGIRRFARVLRAMLAEA